MLKYAFKDDRGSFTIIIFFKQWEFYEILCVIVYNL